MIKNKSQKYKKFFKKCVDKIKRVRYNKLNKQNNSTE